MSERTVIPSPDTLIAHAGFVRAVARKLLLDDHEVDDVVQQTLLAALEKPPRSPGPLKPWLATVARNLARMRRRTEGRIDRREQAAARPESTPATSEIAARLETQRKLVEVVTALDEPYRDVVVLRFFDELPPREVAARLGIPVETVRTRTRRALEQLRGQLDRETDGGRKAWQLALLPLALPPARTQVAVATTTVGILGVLGVKSIATIAAVLIAAVLFLWNETASDADPGATRVAETRRSDDGVAASEAASGVTTGAEPEDEGGARGTAPSSDFYYRAVVVDEEGEPVRGAQIDAGQHGKHKTDANGATRIGGQAGENYLKVKIAKEGYVPLEAILETWREDAKQFILRRGEAFRVRVLSLRGAPVVGAKCKGYIKDLSSRTANVWYVGFEETREAVSDADGLVDFGRIHPDDLKIEVNHPDFAWFEKEWTKEEIAREEFEVRLAFGGTVRGVVRGPDGTPVEGAKVASRMKTTTTGSDGSYELAHVMTTGVAIAATHPSHGPGAFGSAVGWDRDIDVRVAEGGEVDGIDIVLGKATLVRGRLVDHEGHPVTGLRMNFYIIGGAYRNSALVTDEEGRFEAGPFRLRGATATWHIFYSKSETHRVPENLKWTLKKGETLDIGDIKVESQPLVRGRVLDPSGKPVAARMKATVDGPGALTWVQLDGTFEMRLEPGMRRIYASATSADGVELRSQPQMIDALDNKVAEVELKLRRAVAVTGQVVLPDGAPKKFEAVVLMPASAEDSWPAGTGLRSGTNREGEFRIFVTEPGEYVAGVPEADGKTKERFRRDVPTQAVVVEQQPVGDLRFVVRAPKKEGVRVFGSVVAAKGGKPIRDFTIELVKYKFFMADNTFHTTVFDRQGEFEKYAKQPGTYALKVRADGYSAFTTNRFPVKASGEVDLGTIKLEPALKLTGHVRDPNGAPIPYAQITLLGGGGDVGGGVFTDAHGHFEIGDADVGLYNIFAVSPRHPVAIVKGVSVKHGQKNHVEIEVPDTSPLTIHVKDENGRPVEGAELIWTFPEVAPFTSKEFGGYEPPSFGENKSDADGLIRKPYTPSAPITVRILKKGFATDSRVIQTKKGEPITVEVVLKRK